MRVLRNRTIFYILILSAFIIYGAGRASAFSLDPSKAEFFVNKGEKLTKEYIVKNPGSTSAKIYVSVEPAKVFDGSGDASPWFKVSSRELMIPANDSRKIKVTLSTPKDVSGEYVCSLVFKEKPRANAGTVGLGAQISLMAYVIIKGTGDMKCEISSLQILQTSPLKISVKVKNSGNIHVRPKGEVEILEIIKGDAGVQEKSLGSLPLNPIDGPIFPGIDGEIGPKVREDIIMEPATYKAKVRVELNPEIMLRKETEFSVSNPVK